mmetsp:Transcript_16032/g.25368  ORF Transcript_16032/g.25368 Transcript_16032/m.25368 type:complete len:84 (+) Transcript_16032:161-412(+)
MKGALFAQTLTSLAPAGEVDATTCSIISRSRCIRSTPQHRDNCRWQQPQTRVYHFSKYVKDSTRDRKFEYKSQNSIKILTNTK